MDYNVSEQFISLSLNPENGRYFVTGNYLTYGVLGAIIMDLALSGHLVYQDGVLLSTGMGETGLPSHDMLLDRIGRSGRQRSIKKWLLFFGSRGAGVYRKELQKYLVRNGVLNEERKRFICIPYKLYFVASKTSVSKLANRYKDIILYGKKPEDHEIMLMGLMFACRMHRILGKTGEERRNIRNKLKDIVKNNKLSSELSKYITEIQAAVAAAVASAAAAASSSAAAAAN